MDLNAMGDDKSDTTDSCCSCTCHLKHNEGAEKEVHESNNKFPDYQRNSVKEYLCRNGCGTKIRFDKNKVSESKKIIPLDPDGTPHICSKAPKIPCRFCAKEISFERTPSDKWIAHDPDGSFHACPRWPDVARPG